MLINTRRLQAGASNPRRGSTLLLSVSSPWHGPAVSPPGPGSRKSSAAVSFRRVSLAASCAAPHVEQARGAGMGLPCSSQRVVVPGVSVFSVYSFSLSLSPHPQEKRAGSCWEVVVVGDLGTGGEGSHSLPKFAAMQEIVCWLGLLKCFSSTSQLCVEKPLQF